MELEQNPEEVRRVLGGNARKNNPGGGHSTCKCPVVGVYLGYLGHPEASRKARVCALWTLRGSEALPAPTSLLVFPKLA